RRGCDRDRRGARCGRADRHRGLRARAAGAPGVLHEPAEGGASPRRVLPLPGADRAVRRGGPERAPGRAARRRLEDRGGRIPVSAREQQFLEVYRKERADDQRNYYEKQAGRAQAAHRQLLAISAVVFGVSGAVAVLSGVDVQGKLVWAILAAILPAL